MVGRAALLCGPPHGGACCVGAWPPSWWSVVCWCLPAAVVWFGGVWLGLSSSIGWVTLAVVLLAWPGLVLCWCAPPPPAGACRVCSWPPPWWGVLCRRIRVLVRGVVAGSMLGFFWWFPFVSDSVGWHCPVLVVCGVCLAGVGAILVRAPPPVGACCVCAWPLPCWGVLCWCVPPPSWGVLRWFGPPSLVGPTVMVRGPHHGGACCVGACPTQWWCLAWVVVVCWVGCGSGCVVSTAGVGAVLVRGPPLLGRAVCVRAPPPLMGRVVSVCLGFGSWCCSRLDARLVLVLCCCLRRCTACVVGCWLSVGSSHGGDRRIRQIDEVAKLLRPQRT